MPRPHARLLVTIFVLLIVIDSGLLIDYKPNHSLRSGTSMLGRGHDGSAFQTFAPLGRMKGVTLHIVYSNEVEWDQPYRRSV